MQPEQILPWVRSKIKKEWMISFFAVIFLGLLAHFYKFTNFLPNWDSLLNLYTDQNKIELGRCFLAAACSLGSYYDLPWINGLLSLVYIAGSAVCVSELFHIRKTIPLVLISGLMVTFPTVTSTLAYNYTADGYFLALLCVCAAVILTIRCRKGIMVAALLIAFSLGVYQAYITFAMVLMLIYLIDQMLFYHMSLRGFWKMIVRFGVCCVLGAIGYWMSMKILLPISGVTLSDYQSIDSTFALQGFQFFHAILQAGYQFLIYFFDFSQGINLFLILNIILVFVIVTFFLLAFHLKKTAQEPWRLILILLCMAALPFASYAHYFANSVLDYHNLMVMCLCLFYILPVLFYERLSELSETAVAVKQWVIVGLSMLTIYNFTLLANISYQKLHVSYEKSYGVMVRLADRIEQLPGADHCKKIAVIGCLPGSESISVNFPPDMTGITDSYIIRKQDTMMHENVTQFMLRDYCGLSYEDTTEEEIQSIRNSEEFQKMNCWPNQNSIAVIGDTLVIQFEEEIQ